MTDFVVTTASDSGDDATVAGDVDAETLDGTGLSLREALILANGDPDADTIAFADGSGEAFEAGATILLLRDNGALPISTDVSILGAGKATVTATATYTQSIQLLEVTGGESAISGVNFRGSFVYSNTTGGFDAPLNISGAGTRLTIENSVISDNFHVGAGGAVSVTGGANLSLASVQILNNTADSAGGGLFIGAGSSVDMENSAVTGNTSNRFSGGGVFVEAGGGLSAIRSSFISNLADYGRTGGAIYNRGTLFLDSSLFQSNRAEYQGASIRNLGQATIENSAFISNFSPRLYGAGNIQNSGTLSITNGTFVGNRGAYASVLQNSGSGTAEIFHSTIVGNTTAYGSRLDIGHPVVNRSSGALTIENSIITRNPDTGLPGEERSIGGSGPVFATNNLIGVDPALVFETGAPANNGGPVPTLALRLGADNPALDASQGANIPGTDARGELALDQPGLGAEGNAEGIRDIGAYELSTALNSPPEAVDDAATTDEDVPVTIAVQDNDSDIEGDALISSVSDPVNGAAEINPDGTISYTPDRDYFGPDVFTYTLSDAEASSEATVSVTVNAVNDPPEAVDDAATTDEDVPVTIAVLDNDSDIEGDALISAVSDPVNGAAEINPDGTISYTPDPDYFGPDVFTYTLSDAEASSEATVSVTVNAVNDPPEAVDDAATTDEDVPVTIAVLDNDSDIEGDALISAVSDPVNGATEINPDGTIRYTPDPDYFGADVFTYTLSDAEASSEGTVSVTVNAVDDPPVAVPALDPWGFMVQGVLLLGLALWLLRRSASATNN